MAPLRGVPHLLVPFRPIKTTRASARPLRCPRRWCRSVALPRCGSPRRVTMELGRLAPLLSAGRHKSVFNLSKGLAESRCTHGTARR